MRFAAVISHPIQHYSPIFRELAKVPGVTVRVIYLCDHGTRESFDEGFGTAFSWDVPLTEGYDHVFLRPGFSPVRFTFNEVDSPRVASALEEFQPDMVWVHGYGQRISWRAVRWARKKAAVIYFGDSELLHARKGVALALKRVVLPWFFRWCDAFITVGDNNEAYYRHYGVPPRKFVRGACPIDLARFTPAPKVRAAARARWRAEFGIGPEDVVILFSGKLQPYKRPLDLVQALAKAGNLRLHLLYIGEGPLKAELLSCAASLGVQERVHCSGFVNQQAIPEIMAAGDVMAVTSERDAHPLVVTEAMALGLPIIASDMVGCVGPTDTARPNVNALVYRCGDIDALATAMRRLAEDDDLRKGMGEESLRLAPGQDVSATVKAVLAAWQTLSSGDAVVGTR